MEFFKDKFSRNSEEIINKEFVGKSVMTIYNWKIYRVDRIEFKMSPMDGFTNDEGQKIAFYDYYKERYKVEIQVQHQPLLVHVDWKKDNTEKELYLIPELCVMTGLNEN